MGEVKVPKTSDFTERLEMAVVVAHTPEGLVVLEFLKPDISLYADEETGQFTKQEGKLASDVRIYLPLKTAKRLLNILKEHIEKLEEQDKISEETTEKEH